MTLLDSVNKMFIQNIDSNGHKVIMEIDYVLGSDLTPNSIVPVIPEICNKSCVSIPNSNKF